MRDKKIVIPDIECLEDEQYATLIEILESLPLNYEIWEKEN